MPWKTEDQVDDSGLKMKSGSRRNTLSLSDLRTPIVDNLISMLPSGHDKALKYAFYNVIALILAGVCILALGAVYCILEPFIKSLLWALLCGSVLYPFKRKLVTATQAWFSSIKESPTPFTIHLVSSPLIAVDAISERIGDYVWTYWKAIGTGLASFFVTYVVYYNPPVTLGLILKLMLTTSFATVMTILSWVRGEVIIALHAVYIGVGVNYFMARSASLKPSEIAGPKEQEEPQPSTSKAVPRVSDTVDIPTVSSIRILSIFTWSLTFLYICRILPYTFLIPIQVFMIAGAVAYFRGKSRESKYTLSKISLYTARLVLNIGNGPSQSRPRSILNSGKSSRKSIFGSNDPSPQTPSGTLIEERSDQGKQDPGVEPSDVTEHGPMEFKSPVFTEESEDEVDGSLIDSNNFLYGVFIACVAVQVWNHLWLAHLLPIPVLYYAFKKMCLKFGAVEFLQKSVSQPICKFYSEEEGPSRELFPEPVRVFFRIISIADRKLGDFCEAYLDPVASSIVLVLVVMFTILLLIFACTQVYFEGDHLIRVSVDLINSTVSQHPEINQMLPEGWQTMMGSMVGNAYLYGREYITNTIRDSIEEKNPEKAHEIEKQVIELWDKVYLSWNKTWDGAFDDASKEISEPDSGSGIEWNELLETGKSVPQLLDFSILANYAKANLGTLMSVLESFWSIVIGNVSVAISAVTAVLSVVLGGGTAIVNLMINFVVFFTALFYLISSSTTVYKPVEMFSSWAPGDSRHGNTFLYAVEEAINGVFTASFKMAAFYGMWTWLIHSLFQINIVFVPTFLAALFGAVPLLMPYWAALPAVLELSLIQGEWTLAIMMFLAQMAPMSMVDTQIYSEIAGGGHPYLTGLAVAGGIFYFGIQGAIMGPVILCCVFVAVKMGTSFIRDETDAPELTLHNSKPFLSHRTDRKDYDMVTPS